MPTSKEHKKRHLGRDKSHPFVTAFENGEMSTKAERGKNIDWVINIEWSSYVGEVEKRLRIEVIDR
ncbi:MAG: hypothetical protein ACKO0Z_21225 [Betaproteobacteria bacterium]